MQGYGNSTGNIISGKRLFNDKLLGRDYTHTLSWFLEHKPFQFDKEPIRKVSNSIIDGGLNRQPVGNQFHHSEQWLFMYVHDRIKDEVGFLMRSNPTIQKIYGMGINVYSTNDVCHGCGPMCDKALTLLKHNLSTYCDRTEIKRSKGFSVFSMISSTFRYPTAYKKRPAGEYEETSDYYLDFYSQHRDVSKKSQSLKDLDGKSLYFWVPRKEFKPIQEILKEKYTGLNVEYINGKFHITVGHENNISSFIEFINKEKELITQKIENLNLEDTNVELITINRKDNKDKKIYPSEIKKLTSLKILNLSKTNARSLNLPSIFQSLKFLTQLNLERAIINYSDHLKDDHSPRKKLFQSLKQLPNLIYLNLSNNNITLQEGEFLLSENKDTLALPAILYLLLDNNKIAGSYKEEMPFLSIIKNFISDPKRVNKPKEFSLLNQTSNSSEENIKIHDIIQSLLDKNMESITDEMQKFNLLD